MKNSQDYDMLLIEMLKGIFYLVWLTERQMRAISGLPHLAGESFKD